MVVVVLVLSLAKSKPSSATHTADPSCCTLDRLYFFYDIYHQVLLLPNVCRRVDVDTLTHTKTHKTSFANCINLKWDARNYVKPKGAARRYKSAALALFIEKARTVLETRRDLTYTNTHKSWWERERLSAVSSLGGQKRTSFRSFRWRRGQWTVCDWFIIGWKSTLVIVGKRTILTEREREDGDDVNIKKNTHTQKTHLWKSTSWCERWVG